MSRRRSTQIVKKSSKIGLAPGHLVFLGDTKTASVDIQLMDYSAEHLTVKDVNDLKELETCLSQESVSWIDISGLHDTKIIEETGRIFNIHPLTLEDILNTDQRPKVDFYDHYIYLVVKMLSYNEKENGIEYEQVSFILGKSFVISFQENKGDVFDTVRLRITSGKGRIRSSGADYLLYSLLDVIVDNYFLIMEKFGETIELYEEKLAEKPDAKWLTEVYHLKRELLFLRRSVWPIREVVTKLERDENPLLNEKTVIYLRDVYDHSIQVIESIEIYRDMISGLLDLYLSSVSNRMNEVMKILTIIATIFIPLTFIVGIYGMNFENMPELKWKYGYYIIMAFMLILGVGMFIAFKRRKWL
jgi:magnesium transporter